MLGFPAVMTCVSRGKFFDSSVRNIFLTVESHCYLTIYESYPLKLPETFSLISIEDVHQIAAHYKMGVEEEMRKVFLKTKGMSKKMKKALEFEKRMQEKEFERAFFREFWPDNV
ncbi:hypothetical protein HAX54_028953 [Datura stramonium]|uniref:Uncharacterized protein n=1 Tax=Datura stramonium TaxID=4076 RepID=A0ABS8V783_DATST|nr:hypothetical protein [Datura stramonium]